MAFREVYDNDKLVKRLSPDISLQEAIDNGEIADLSLELQDVVKRAANDYKADELIIKNPQSGQYRRAGYPVFHRRKFRFSIFQQKR